MAIFDEIFGEDAGFQQGRLKKDGSRDASKAWTAPWAYAKNDVILDRGDNQFDHELVTLSAGGASVEVVKLTLKNPKPGWGPYYITDSAGNPEVHTKKFIVLHNTAGGVRGSIGNLTWDRSAYGQTEVSTPYVVGVDGTIYMLHDDQYWAHHASNGSADHASVGIELINYGPLVPNADGTRLLTYLGSDYCDITQEKAYHKVNWRDHDYFASYGDLQYEATAALLNYLCAKWKIPFKLVEEPKRYEKFCPYGVVPPSMIYSHINFDGRNDPDPKRPGKIKWAKYDIGPGFSWDRLMPKRGYVIPVDYAGKAAKEKKGYKDPQELKITRKMLDDSYKHTEKDNKGGYFPLGANTTWHGGVHLHAADQTPVVACADGEVIAVRLEYIADKDDRPILGSRNFVLLRHTLEEGALGELLSLHVPASYTILEDGVSYAKSKGGEELLPLVAGDVLKRRDAIDKRELRHDWAEVKIHSLVARLSLLQGYDVFGTPNVLWKDAGKSEKLADLVHEDRLRLTKDVDLAKGESAPSGMTKVRLVKLGKGFLEVWSYQVSGDYTGFRTEAGAAVSRDATQKDVKRKADLHKGDILKKVKPDDAGTTVGGQKWYEVELTTLGDVKEEPTAFALTATVELREEGKKSAAVVGVLGVGDEVDLVQPKSAADGGKLFDVIIPRKLAGEVEASYEVVGDDKDLYAVPGGAELRALAKTTVLKTTGPVKKVGGSRWAPVEVGEGAAKQSGWILINAGVKPTMANRSDLDWAKSVIGKSYFVESKRYGTATATKARETGARGFVTSDGLKAHTGLERQDHYKPLLTKVNETGAPAEKIYWVELPGTNLVGWGQTRAQRYDELKKTSEGFIQYDDEKMRMHIELPESIREDFLRASGGPGKPEQFYSLYMHISDDVEPTAANLEQYPWVPRVGKKYTMKVGGRLYTNKEKALAVRLLEGDKLLGAGRSGGSDLHPVTIESLVKKEVTGFTVSKGPVLLSEDSDQKLALAGLMPGDEMKLHKEDSGQGAKRRVIVTKLAAGPCDGSYKAKLRGKGMHSAPNPKTRIFEIQKDDVLKVIAPCEYLSGGLKWNYVELVELGPNVRGVTVDPDRKVGARGWIALSKDFKKYYTVTAGKREEVQAGCIGRDAFVKFDAKALSPVEEDRTALYKAFIDSKAVLYLEFADHASDVVWEVDPEFVKLVKKGEVVNVGMPDEAKKIPAVYPQVGVGDPLWASGQYGAEETDNEIEKRKPRIHWEIFSLRNLARHHKNWSKAQDLKDDYNIDNPEIIKAIRKALAEDEARGGPKAKDVLGENEEMDQAKVVSFYSSNANADVMRRFACKFVIEWGMDVAGAVAGMKARGRTLSNGLKKQVEEQLWWEAAVKAKVPLPEIKHIYHYNPIGLLETLSEAELKRQTEKNKKRKKLPGEPPEDGPPLPDVASLRLAKDEESWDELEWDDVVMSSITVVAQLKAAVPTDITAAEYEVEIVSEHGKKSKLLISEINRDDRTLVRGTLDAEAVANELGIIAPDGSYVTSDTTLDADGGDVDSVAFEDAMAKIGKGPKLTGARKGGEDQKVPAANFAFLLAGGAQKFKATFAGVESPWRLLKYEASYFYHSGHGYHDTGEIMLSDGKHGPAGTGMPWWTNVKVCIIAGCSVLDCDAYGYEPGREWLKTGAKLYLGYAGSGPGDASGKPSKIIEDWCTKLGSGTGTAKEWCDINLAERATNACAIDVTASKFHWIAGVKMFAHVTEKSL